MKPNKLRAIGLIVCWLLMLLFWLFWRGCNSARQERNNLLSQIAEYQLKEKQFTAKRLSDSSTIVEQSQTILSQKEAIKLGMAELDKKMRDLQVQVRQKSEVRVVDKLVPFIPDGWIDTTGVVLNGQGEIIRQDSISVPKRFQTNEKWFNIDGLVTKQGILIDSLSIPNKTTVTVGTKKTGFLGLGSEAVVTVKNDSPYVNVLGLDNIVIKNKKKWFQTTAFKVGVGIAVGFTLNNQLNK